MIIIETPIFTRLIKELMSDDEYRELQEALVKRPDMGPIIKSSIKGSGTLIFDLNIKGSGTSIVDQFAFIEFRVK